MNPPLRCPSCAYTLTEKEQHIGLCDACGKVFALKDLLSRQKELSSKETADLRAILAERLAAGIGVVFILSGLILISFSDVGIGHLLSKTWASLWILTIAAIARQRIYEEALYPVLLCFGIVWLSAGLLLWGYL